MKTWFGLLAITYLSIFIISETSRPQLFFPQESFDHSANLAIFNDQYVPLPSYLAEKPIPPKVLGENNDSKKIYVDLTHQRLYAFEGQTLLYDFQISSGKWGRTPTGTFTIWGKFRYTKMSGGSHALHTYYYLPNVPYVMFFSNDQVAASRGFSLHGTYWHNNFGHPMSHGCVNMKTPDAKIIYEWSGPVVPENKSGRASQENPGTEIIIYGVTPQN